MKLRRTKKCAIFGYPVFPSVLWHCLLGHLTRKKLVPDVTRVQWDVKPCLINQPVNREHGPWAKCAHGLSGAYVYDWNVGHSWQIGTFYVYSRTRDLLSPQSAKRSFYPAFVCLSVSKSISCIFANFCTYLGDPLRWAFTFLVARHCALCCFVVTRFMLRCTVGWINWSTNRYVKILIGYL